MRTEAEASRRGRVVRAGVALATLYAVAAGTRPAAAAPDRSPLVFAVVVGNNDGLGMLPRLRYADDDALRFYRLATRLTPRRNVALLTELDVDTWRRIQHQGERPPPYLPPSRDKVLEVLTLFKEQIRRARRRVPARPVHLLFFFSGHGEKGYFFLKKKGAGDRLAQSVFTGSDLDRAFASSEATLNALFIDACKSQSLFIAKGAGPAEDAELGPDFGGLIKQLERAAKRRPIGVLTSTVSDKPAGESHDIRGGYFSHVLISGLRGAADANSDGVIRYGELAAFVAFHTRRIAGQRPWFRPPQGKLETPLVHLRRRDDVLEIPPGLGGHMAVFDEAGRRLVLELHKTPAQWSRLILAPGTYKVVWIKRDHRGLAALADVGGGARRLMLRDFDTPVQLGPDRLPRGEGPGAPPGQEHADDALAAFDPGNSGFDQPFTPRVVSAMAVAYNSGLTARSDAAVATSGGGDGGGPPRHLLSLGYGYYSPPVEPMASGQGISLAYALRVSQQLPLFVGARALFGFSRHTLPVTGLEFDMRRVALQAEGRYALSLLPRLELAAGAYLGWQMTLVTRDVLIREGETERRGTVLNGDALGLRAGLSAGFRVRVWGGLWAAVEGAYGVELVNQDDDRGDREAQAFLRPQVYGQVGYAF